MKFNKFLLAFMGLGLGLSSCNLENDVQDNYITSSFRCANLVIPADEPTFATEANYTLQYFTTTGEISIGGVNVNLGSKTFNFTSAPMQSSTTYYDVDWSPTPLDVTTFNNGYANDGSMLVQNLNGFSSSIVNILSEVDPINNLFPFRAYVPLVISYNVNYDYTIKTFMPDAIYKGMTVVNTIGSTDEPRNVDGIRYRVVFDSEFKKASIFFYEANFGSPMPANIKVNFLLKDLDVEFVKNGYRIYGTNVVPLLYANGGWDENPAFPFPSFEFINTSDDLTVGIANYRINAFGTEYSCSFSGYYVLAGGTQH